MQHIDALFGYAMSLTRNQSEAEDLVQETYLKAVRAAAQLAPDSNLKSWLFVIMRNAWLNQLRHRKSAPRLIELDSEDSKPWSNTLQTSNNPHVIYMRKLDQLQVRTAILDLPDAYREIVILRDIEGFSYQEIANILACPAGTVMSRLGRAREKLRQMLSGWQPRKKARSV